MLFEEQLIAYAQEVTAWKLACGKSIAAVKKLEAAVAIGNVRELEKLREKAKALVEEARTRAEELSEWTFDAEAYLRDGQFLAELRQAADMVGLRLYEGDGVLHCPPVLVRTLPEMEAVRIEKKLVPGIRPIALAKALKQLQDKGAKATDSRKFIEVLFAGYQVARGSARLKNHSFLLDQFEAVAIEQVHRALTILPGTAKDYSLADFLRDLYHLTKSDVSVTKDGHRVTVNAASTRGKVKPLRYVADDGSELLFAFVQFTPTAVG
jgi:hypothetical protein